MKEEAYPLTTFHRNNKDVSFNFHTNITVTDEDPQITTTPNSAETSSKALFTAFQRRYGHLPQPPMSRDIWTVSMMTSEVEASNFLERELTAASLVLIMFEIITVILLMNLLISLAVRDVAQLRESAEETMFSLKA